MTYREEPTLWALSSTTECRKGTKVLWNEMNGLSHSPSFPLFLLPLSLCLCVCSETESQYIAKADLQLTVLSLSTSLPGFRNEDF